MTHAEICVELPKGQWKADATHEFPDTTEIVVLADDHLSERLCAIQTHPDVDSSSVVQRSEQEIIIQLETSRSRMLTAANRAATPLSYPIELRNGRALVDIIGTHASINRFGSMLTEADLGFRISYLQRDQEIGRVLTQRQEEFVHAAVEFGYYDTPRRCSLTELATEMDVVKSTCSEILHRAEQALVEYFLGHHSTPDHGESASASTSRDSAVEESVGPR